MKLSNFIASTTKYFKREFNPNETMQWLTAKKMQYFSWGVSKRMNLANKGLLLRVHGRHFNGYVLITLDWNDIYEVHFIRTNGTLQSSHTEIYCDSLAEFIDTKIEYIPAYND